MRFLIPFLLGAAALVAQKQPGFDVGALNRSVDPCENFYQFACGAWMTANPIPGDQSRWGRFDLLQERNRTFLQNLLETASSTKRKRTALEQKIGDFYASCMDEDTIESKGLSGLKPELDRIAGLTDRKALTAQISHMFSSGYRPLFNFASEPDPKNSTQVIANVDQGGLGLPDRDYYLNTDQKSVDLRKQYVAHLERLLKLLGAADPARQAQAMLDMETELAKGSLDRVSRRDPEKVYHKLTVEELATLAPLVDWKAFFKEVGAPAFTSLDVSVPDYFRAMNKVLAEQDLDTLKTYFSVNLVRDSVPFVPKTIEQEVYGFFEQTLRGAKELRPRWKRCVDLTDEELPDALGLQFVQKTLGEAGKKRTAEMVAAIEKAMEKDIRGLDWMTPKTKEQALAKLHAITNKIGNQAKWRNYATVKVVRGDGLGNAMRASDFELRRQLAKIGKPVDKTEWQMSQPTVNAYYDPQVNDINFPAGILQPPFWDNSLDDAVNFGAIGSVIGHELTHAFDDQGRQFDAAGNLRDWWTEEDAKAFNERADCIVQQYSGYSPVPGLNLNGKLTLGENTADNGGLRIAYMALMDTLAAKTEKAAQAAAKQAETAKIDGFTPEQRFFLGWAQVWCQNVAEENARLRVQTDPHSPGEFRVNGVVSNMPEFQKAFMCRTGQPMVRGPMCRVW